MRFTLATVIAAIPFLVVASPIQIKNTGTKVELSKRSNIHTASGAVDFERLNNHMSAVQAKMARGFAAYERNTGSKHPLAPQRSAAKRDSGAVSLTDDQENLWYGSISVGTPPVTYNVDFDTGSSDLFLPGPDCSTNCDKHTAYDPSQSSSSSKVGKTFTLKYGDGSEVSGDQYTDDVTIAGVTASPQTLGAAKKYSTGFGDQFPADGLMGMGFQSISEYNASPVFQSLNNLDSSVFAFKLSDSGAELYIGGTDSSLYTGDFSYAAVTKQGYWQVSMDGVNVGGNSALSTADAIIDTGTTLIVGDSDSVATFYKAIPGSKKAPSSVGDGLYTFPCKSPPAVQLGFGGTFFDVSSDTFSLGPVSDGSSECIGGVVAMDGQDFWIVGDVFLRNVYTVFDYGNTQVGFATLA